MALMGKAAVVLWTAMRERQAHDDWHSREHLPERIGIDGFLRGRRCAALDADKAYYFVLYEVEDLTVMTSPAYLTCLNNPSAWTARTMGAVQNVNRTLCEIVFSIGAGVGSEVLTVSLAPAFGNDETLTTSLAGKLRELASRPGLVGAHLLKKSAGIRPETKERELRQRPDASEDWVLVVEGYDAGVLEDIVAVELSSDSLLRIGAAPLPRAERFRLAHLLEDGELRRSLT